MKRIVSLFKHEFSFFCSIPALLWQALFLGIPLLLIIYYSFILLPDGTFTLNHYVALLQTPYFFILFRSLVLAFVTAWTTLLLAYPVAYFLAFYAQKWKNFFLFLLTLPFWTNFLIQIYAWFFLLERNGLINKALLGLGIISQPLSLVNTQFGIFIVMVYCYFPFMIMPVYSVLEKMDKRLLEASADLGATQWQTFLRITIPNSYSGIKTGLLLVFVPAFGEFVIPALVGGSKYMMVGSLISYLFLIARNTGSGSAFTVISGIVLFFAVVWFFYLFGRLKTPLKRG